MEGEQHIPEATYDFYFLLVKTNNMQQIALGWRNCNYREVEDRHQPI